jgi:hypothetical protein
MSTPARPGCPDCGRDTQQPDGSFWCPAACPASGEHVALDSRVTVTPLGAGPFEGIVNGYTADGVLAVVYVPALNNTLPFSPGSLTVIEPTPLPDLDPVEALASIIAKATVALSHGIAAENEGVLRTSVHEIRDLSASLADLVDRW